MTTWKEGGREEERKGGRERERESREREREDDYLVGHVPGLESMVVSQGGWLFIPMHRFLAVEMVHADLELKGYPHARVHRVHSNVGSNLPRHACGALV